MEQFSKILRIRNLPIDTDLQAKRVIEMAIDEYDIVPFVPIVQKLRYHERHSRLRNFSPRNILKKQTQVQLNSREITFSKFWLENMKQLSREFYLGKLRKFRERITFRNKRFRLLPKYSEPIFQGDLSMKAEDMKSEIIAKALLRNYENELRHFILIDILSIRPLTLAEYVSLFLRYPETVNFVDAALGFSYERLFNEIFEKNTSTVIPLTIAPYLADVYPKRHTIELA